MKRPEPYSQEVLDLCLQGMQHCHICPRLDCGDNMSPRAAGRWKERAASLEAIRRFVAWCARSRQPPQARAAHALEAVLVGKLATLRQQAGDYWEEDGSAMCLRRRDGTPVLVISRRKFDELRAKKKVQ